MAVEARRACGYRKVGGLYLVAPKTGHGCDRLPILLETCPCCGAGIKQARGWTWVDVSTLVGGIHKDCQDEFPCPLCMATPEMGRAGLLWVGEQYYPTVMSFAREANELGISKRISAVPQGFELGKTWVLLAHPKACVCPSCQGNCFVDEKTCPKCDGKGELGGIFRVFQPTAVEKIITKRQSKDQVEMKRLKLRGITPVVVPDDDPDHARTY